ncbi:MAG TPA: AarF/ABC1/UbiB kinase family protein, partial [Opitutaceae bacterium]|nr:AarF/ABC1/UbiB kinase family protein [Opitutaceae bacterium]
LLKLLLEVSEGNGEEAADIVVRISDKSDDFDQTEFRHRIGQIVALRRDRGLHQFNIGQALLEVGRQARDNGVFVPGELALLGKTLLQLNEIGQLLDPAFDPTASVRHNASDLLLQRLRRQFTVGNVFSSLLEIKEFVGHLPTRLNRLLDAMVNSELEVKVQTPDAKTFLDGMQKIANRITAGIILAALIVGASLLMRVQTSFRMFGYPGFAMLCFLAAAAGGFWLVVKIFLQDYRSRKKMSE